MTLDGTLDMSEPNAALSVMNGLTLDTDLNLSGAGASLNFVDGSTLAGHARTVRPERRRRQHQQQRHLQTMIIGQGITISGDNANSSISGPIDNLGTIEQNGAGQMTVNDWSTAAPSRSRAAAR